MKLPVEFEDLPQILPHRDPMILIDRVLEKGEEYLLAEVDLGKQSLFMEQSGLVPSYVGFEYMAQAISALIGMRALENNRPVKLGFLLGTRKYKTDIDYFPKNERIRVRVDISLFDDEFGVFDCTIVSENNKELATAALKAIQPDDILATVQ